MNAIAARARRLLRAPVGLLLGAAVLAGCEGAGAVYSVQSPDYGFKREFESLAQSGAAPVTVVGNPFGGDKAAFDRTVADAVGSAYYGAQTTFVPGGEPIHGRRLVYWFDPAFDPSVNAICRAPESLGHAARPDRVAMLMALCIDDESQIQFAGTLAGSGGAGDPRFRAMVADAVHSLRATRDPMLEGDPCASSDC